MKKATPETDKNLSTEQRIKDAASIVFHKKGYAATRTRDIAEEAGINLALLNYYFRSKEKLFNIIVLETMTEFFKSVKTVFHDESTSLEEKIQNIVSSYIDMLTANPDIPIFLITELRSNPDQLLSKLNARESIMKSSFLSQYTEEVKAGRILLANPLHFIMNLLGLTVFPFIASPILKGLGDLSNEEFNAVMNQRKQLIPKWINVILRTT